MHTAMSGGGGTWRGVTDFVSSNDHENHKNARADAETSFPDHLPVPVEVSELLLVKMPNAP